MSPNAKALFDAVLHCCAAFKDLYEHPTALKMGCAGFKAKSLQTCSGCVLSSLPT